MNAFIFVEKKIEIKNTFGGVVKGKLREKNSRESEMDAAECALRYVYFVAICLNEKYFFFWSFSCALMVFLCALIVNEKF